MARIEKVSGVKQHTVYKTADGKRVPGTTTVLSVLAKPHLIKWANDLGLNGIDSTKYTDKMATIGTIAHYLVECHCKSEKPNLDAYSKEEINLAENAFISFLEWEKDKEVEYLHNELVLVSEAYKYGGTIDCVAKINGVMTLLDFKTGKAIYPEMLIQLAAYRKLLTENGYFVTEMRILRIGRDESEGFEERKETGLWTHWELFKHLRAVYELNKAINRKAG